MWFGKKYQRKNFEVTKVIQPLCYVGKFLGLAAFAQEQHRSALKWKLCTIDIALIVLHIVVQLVLFYYSVFRITLMPSSMAPYIVEVGITMATTFFAFIRVCVSIWFLSIRRWCCGIVTGFVALDEQVGIWIFTKLFQTKWTKLLVPDRQLSFSVKFRQNHFFFPFQMTKLGIEINHKRHYKFVFFYTLFILMASGLCVATTASIILIFEIIHYTIAERVLLVVLFFYTSVTFSVIMSYYFLALLAVRSRISTINAFLR